MKTQIRSNGWLDAVSVALSMVFSLFNSSSVQPKTIPKLEEVVVELLVELFDNTCLDVKAKPSAKLSRPD